MTHKKMDKNSQFMVWTITLLMEKGNTLMDELNLNIKYFKGVDILTYYIPTDPTKDKEPMLNKTLQKKWLPKKTVEQKRQLEKESEARAKNKLKQVAVERGKCNKIPKKSDNNETNNNNILHM